MAKNKGFSLVELSIVLVILGLLTGGILTGQSLIKAAELRSVTTEFGNIQSAINTFKGKYFALPGDMNNAASFWNNAASCTGTAGTNLNPGTCNGDGDGRLDESANANEKFLFWQHLALAGVFEGSYTGTAGTGGIQHHQIGINTPVSKFTNAGWGTDYYTAAPSTDFFNITYGGNILEFGTTQTNGDMDNAALTPEDAWNIDKKIDDGKPARGKVIARRVFSGNACTTAADQNDLDSNYLLTQPSIRCSFQFNNVF
jgi:prepilin-type N-terminal cleavage/methylation domain-containing protein